MMEQLTQLEIRMEPAPDAEIDEKELEKMTRQMQKELEELDVDSVSLVNKAEKPPEGSKVIGLVALGQLLVTFSQAGGVLPTLISLLQSRFASRECSIKLKIGGDELELNGTPDEMEERILYDFLDRHHTG